MTDSYVKLFDDNRNLIPVFSLEGDDERTDWRRGEGVAARVWESMGKLQERGIMTGASITVTSGNMRDVTDSEYVAKLRERGDGVIFYVEFVQLQCGTEDMVLSMEELEEMRDRTDVLRADKKNSSLVFLSGVGPRLFHINVEGAAEPCSFSPFSVANVQETSLLGALRSPFFEKVQEVSHAHDSAEEHMGGCTLFQHKDGVMALMQAS